MEENKEIIDKVIGNISLAKEGLRKAQSDARKVLMGIIIEKKDVKFRPSDFWMEKFENGTEFDRADVLADDDVDPIEYTDENMVVHSGNVLEISLNNDGLVEIRVQDTGSFEEKTITEDDTWDADILLEFVRRFAD